MPKMSTRMDYTISSQPIRIIDRRTDASKLRVTSLRIVNVGHLPGRKLYRREARFGHFAAVYIAGGAGTYRVDGGDVQSVRAGSLFFFYPGASFDFGPDPGGTWDEYYFTIDGPRIAEWTGSWLPSLGRVADVGVDEGNLHRIDHLFQLMESDAPADHDRAALLLEAFLYDLALRSSVPGREEWQDNAAKVMEDLALAVYEPLDAARICERNHVSLSTLRRLVRRSSGYPLNEYVHRLKIAEAKNVLLNTDLPLKAVADRFGYADVFYFSRLFKKYAGISPREYRRNAR